MPGGRVPTRDGSLFSNENARVPHPYAQGTGGNENLRTTSTLITHRQGTAFSRAASAAVKTLPLCRRLERRPQAVATELPSSPPPQARSSSSPSPLLLTELTHTCTESTPAGLTNHPPQKGPTPPPNPPLKPADDNLGPPLSPISSRFCANLAGRGAGSSATRNEVSGGKV